ncbi:MAG: DUF4160 domain-containing protein [Bacteroidota bacterium]
MPKVLEVNGYKFYIYTDDHVPVHVHVWKSGSEAKVIVVPEIMLKDNYGFKSKELRQIIDVLEEHYEFIIEKWHEIHG